MAQLNPFRPIRCIAKDKTPLPVQPEDWKGGLIKQDSAPAFLIYEQEFLFSGEKRSIKGLLCPVEADEAFLTCSEPESYETEKVIEKVELTGSQFHPVYALYDDAKRDTWNRISLLSSGKPRFTITQGDVTHRIWVINDILAVRAIQDDFAPRTLFPVDGLPFYSAALMSKRNGGDARTMMFLADAGQGGLTVLPSHLLCNFPAVEDRAKLVSDCEPFFQAIPRKGTHEISANLDALYRQGKPAFAYYTSGDDWDLFILRESPDAVSVGTELLLSRIPKKLQGISAEREISGFARTDSVEQALKSVESGTAHAAFLFTPPRLTELRALAEAGIKLPPLSYSFYPAIPEGIAGYILNQQ